MFSYTDIREKLNATPFVPFRIVSDTRKNFDIVDPRLVLLGASAVVIGTPFARDPSLFDTVGIVGISHIVKIEEIPAEPAAPGK